MLRSYVILHFIYLQRILFFPSLTVRGNLFYPEITQISDSEVRLSVQDNSVIYSLTYRFHVCYRTIAGLFRLVLTLTNNRSLGTLPSSLL